MLLSMEGTSIWLRTYLLHFWQKMEKLNVQIKLILKPIFTQLWVHLDSPKTENLKLSIFTRMGLIMTPINLEIRITTQVLHQSRMREYIGM